MWYYLIAFTLLFAYKLVRNISCFIRLNHYKKRYIAYLKNNDQGFEDYYAPVIRLFSLAGLKDIKIPDMVAIGYGYAKNLPISVYDNLSSTRNDIVAIVSRQFTIARSTFLFRIRETLSPLHWVDFIIFLPRNIVQFLGADSNKLVSKILQLLYWLLTPTLILFRTQLYHFVSRLLAGS